MPIFGRSHRHNYDDRYDTTARTNDYERGPFARNDNDYGAGRSRRRGGGIFGRKDPERVAAGYRAALANPNTTLEGRENARHELHSMGYSAHVPLMTKIKRTLGIRSTPRRNVNNRRADINY